MTSTKRRVTMREIADTFGISHATVSLALRNHPRISEALRKKIQKKAREMGYRPDPLLTVLAHYRHHQTPSGVQAAIAWINCWSNPKELRRWKEYDAYWVGASETAKKLGYRLEEFIVDKNMPLERLEKVLTTRSIKGVIIPPHREGLNWEKINWEHFSAVRLGRSVQRPEMHIVGSDQAANAQMAFRKIRLKGYQRIGYVGEENPSWMYTGGFVQAQLQAPEAERIPPLLLKPGKPQNQQALVNWLEATQPQAILTTFSDMPAMLNLAGIRIPEDLALAGLSSMDGNISAGIDQNSKEIGSIAIFTVISLINDFAQGIPAIFRQILVQGKWVEGTSLPSLKKASSR